MTMNYEKCIKRISSVFCLEVMCLILAVLLPGCSEQTVKPNMANHLILMVDASGSYKARQTEAIEKAVNLLDGMSKTKLKRWESQSDMIFIISLDASPDTIWQGSLKELKAKSPSFWKERFMARTDYASCTDVSSAFRIAARHLEGDSRYIGKYLFVFSDMLHEPPTSNMRSCQVPAKVSPDDFPWANLGDVSVSIFWMPPDQKLLWRKAVQDRGMEAHFALYTTSESASISIQNPPRPREKVIEADRKEQQDKVIGALVKGFSWVAAGISGFILLIVVGFLVQRYRGRKSTLAFPDSIKPLPVPSQRLLTRPVPMAGRPVSGSRPPVVPPRRRPQ